MPVPDAIAWLDEINPAQAVGVCGAKMGRLAELLRAGVSLPRGFTVTVEAFRQHWDQAGLDEVTDAALAGLGPGAEPAQVEAAASEFRRRAQGEDPDEIPEVSLAHEAIQPEATMALTQLIFKLGLESSTSNARRVIEQGGVTIGPDRRKITDPRELVPVRDGLIVRVGKRKIARVRL